MLAEEGSSPSAFSVRELARRAGVTPPSVTHHFGDKAGVFAAVATEGFELLAEELSAVEKAGGSFLDLGVAYVRFATTHRGHFAVMYRPDLYGSDNPEVTAARRTTAAMLFAGAREIAGAPAGASSQDPETTEAIRDAGVAGWALVHGIATLWLDGNIPPPGAPTDPEEFTRRVARLLGPR